MSTANPKPDIAHEGGPTIFSAIITPHRSLSAHGFLVLFAGVVAFAVFFGIIFAQLGAWPVLGFLGLGVVLVWIAFQANYRAARARETIDVSESEILVRRVSARGAASEWRFNPYWARLLVKRDIDNEIERVALASHGRELEIAAWLSPTEKADFAAALSRALAQCRSGVAERPSLAP